MPRSGELTRLPLECDVRRNVVAASAAEVFVPHTPSPTRVMVLMFTDLVGSVDLKKRLGDAEAVRLISRHDAIFKAAVTGIGAEILKDTGDGFLARFQSSSDAVAAALRFQFGMQAEQWPGKPLRARVGIHLGEAAEGEIESSTGRAKLSGLAVDLAARVMGLALPGQVLLTRAAFDNARQNVREHPPIDGQPNLPPLRWMAHGPYLFHGSDEAMEVFEVGGVGIAPLVVPPDSEKARRAVAADEEETLGWRPAAGMPIPDRKGWVLERRLGEGGFGEVWLGVNEKTKNHRVYKFCYDAERLRSFKRELTLFRLLRDALGDREDIARLYDVRLDEPPFFLESEFTEEGSLIEWAQEQGGIGKVPMATRLDIVARTAEAVAAAHSVGVLHKDIKPGNILIYKRGDGEPRPRLTDFGIGMLTDRTQLDRRNFTVAGFTQTLVGENQTHTGTPLYSPPEVFAGSPFTVQGDVYALGVMLYQMVVGDFGRPLGQGWERHVADPLLREDIAECVAGDEKRRFGSAKNLAERLQSLPQRRKARTRRHAARLTALCAAGLVVLLAIALAVIFRERTLRGLAETELARTRKAMQVVTGMLARSDPAAQRRDRDAGAQVTVVSVLDSAAADAHAHFAGDLVSESEFLRTIGLAYKNLSQYDKARDVLQRALDLRREIHGDRDHATVAESLFDLADAMWWLRQYEAALPLYEESLAMRRTLFPEQSAPVGESLNNLAACLNSLKRYDEAITNYDAALAIRKALWEADPSEQNTLLYGATQNNFGVCLRSAATADRTSIDEARLAKARDLHLAAIEIARKVGGERFYYVAQAMHNLAMCLSWLGEPEEAEKRFNEAIEMKLAVLGPDHASVADSQHVLAQFLVDQGKFDAALTPARDALAIRRRVWRDQDSAAVADSLELLARIMTSLERAPDADTYAREAQQIRDRLARGNGG